MENSLEFKYILYLTMNIVNGKFYIGVHKTDTPYKFDGYLGCGATLDKPFDKEGNLIKIWNNFKDCKKQFPYCLDVCRGKLKSTRGYVFKYQTKDIV